MRVQSLYSFAITSAAFVHASEDQPQAIVARSPFGLNFGSLTSVLQGVGLGGGSDAPTTKSGFGIDLPGFSFGTEDPTTKPEEPTTKPQGPTTKPEEPTTEPEEPTTNPNSCPQVWYDISKDLKQSFKGCNQLAANAIRFAFHDAAGYSSKNDPYLPASGGADGSLLLSDDESSRQINDPMQRFRDFLLPKYQKYASDDVSAADFVQAAGNIGVASCPGGPIIKTVIGRSDSAQAAPEGTLPFSFGPGSDYNSLITLWEEKGINPRELAALMGAHSVSRSFTRQENGIPNGGPQDRTPRSLDVSYYSVTQAKKAPSGVYRFDSDVNLANKTTTCGEAFTEFANDKVAWAKAFQDAMYKLSVLGLSDDKKKNGLMDCTAILQ